MAELTPQERLEKCLAAEGDDMAGHHELLRLLADQRDAAEKKAAGLMNWGKKKAALASQFQSLYAHALVQMERFRDQAKVTDKLRQEQGGHYRDTLGMELQRGHDAGLHDAIYVEACPRCTAELEDDMCPNCVTPWKCNGPHETEKRRSTSNG